MNKKTKIIIFGASGHSKLVMDVVKKEGKYKIFGVIDRKFDGPGGSFEGYDILGSEENLPHILSQNKDVNMGIVAIGDNYTRYKVANKILALVNNFTFCTAIHPTAIIGNNVSIGEGTVIAAGTVINNHTKIGRHCYLAMKAGISHDSILGDYSSLGPGVTTGGNVVIGSKTAVCLGANVLHGKSIGNNTIVGSSSLVVRDIGDNAVAYGIPAKIVRTREDEDRYL